ncbi:hypothetical protein Taro_023993 [Colocasia esculenta]|uniref:Leucine-rich repeat-containing N-terminal plant-type domain-containing protein n=1 Tax=Colocasia esculenta TaxID=4460 RepID=A0A843VCF1_COLES|nr:hypothetical protein [Colocasia esculenta]
MEAPALPPLLLPRHFRPPLLLLLLLLLPPLITVATTSTFPPRCLDSNRRALLLLKAGLRDPDRRLSSWTGRDCCRWSGVTCDNSTGAVVKLDVASSQSPPPLHVDGTPRWLSGLSSLRFLSMNGVDLSPMNSTELFRLLNSGLPSLAELHLADCRLSGIPHSLPTPVINFTSLAVVDLSGNTFRSGTIPTWLLDASTLVSLIMRACGLHGAVPPGLSELPNLETLMLESNSLTGGLPSSIGKLCNLRVLYLEDNNLVGELPQTLEYSDACTSDSPLPSLMELELSYNRISGKLPGWLGELKNMKYLALDSNMFSGPLPLNLGKLSQLVVFSASDNQLSGSVSEAHLTGLKNLDSFYISRNLALTLDVSSDWKPPFQLENLYMGSCKLGPEFPTWIKNQRGLKWLDLSGAGISDATPTWFWGLFSELQGLNLSSNRIAGIVPESIATMKGLTSLDLSKNRFSGSLPSSLASMARLSFLDLSDNNFSGGIPDGGGMQSFNKSAFHGNPHLCGPPTDTQCGGDSSQSGKGGRAAGGGAEDRHCSCDTTIAHLLMGISCLGIAAAVLLLHVCICRKCYGLSRKEDGTGDKASLPTGSGSTEHLKIKVLLE